MKITLILATLLVFSQTLVAQDRIIAIQGLGKIEASPDLIKITYSVSNRSETDASAAKAYVDEVASSSVSALLEVGVEKGNISSSSFNVSRSADFDNKGNVIKYYFQVSRQIEAELTDIDLYNPVIQALVDSNITEIQNVDPRVSNYDELERKAIALAAANARENAEFLAGELGAKVGKVHQIGRRQVRQSVGYEDVVLRRQRKAARPNSFQFEFKPGVIEVTATIYTEFELE